MNYHTPFGLCLRKVATVVSILCLGATLFVAPGNSLAQTPEEASQSDEASQAVKLYYLRNATTITTIINSIATRKDPPSDLNGLVVSALGDDEVVLYGPKKQRDHARRLIAALDLPRPGVTMEMWGIQVSSRKPKRLEEVMPLVRNEIDSTQVVVRETYDYMQRFARDVVKQECSYKDANEICLNKDFRDLLVQKLGYRSALDENRALSIPDILLRLVAADPPGKATEEFANKLNHWFVTKHPEYANALAKNHHPFEKFFATRGLVVDCKMIDGKMVDCKWIQDDVMAHSGALMARKALVAFGLHYGQLVHEPGLFSAYHLQQSAELLNSRLQDATDALNADMEDLFVEPTLKNIRGIFRDKFKDVEYAQVGKTSVASLSGTSTEVTSKSVNAFDVTPPLRLSELLETANKLSQGLTSVVPAGNAVGKMPLTDVIGLIGAFGEERSVWRELNAGITLTITPNVLRNMASAELAIKLETGDPQGGTREKDVRPLSRVSQHDVKTSVYVTALDFFDLSAFASQSTLGGQRGYVPIIGPVWQGLFGAIPVAGQLFSWQKAPQSVFSESLVLTTSFVSPTAMGLAILYPTETVDPETGKPVTYNFRSQADAVRTYTAALTINSAPKTEASVRTKN